MTQKNVCNIVITWSSVNLLGILEISVILNFLGITAVWIIYRFNLLGILEFSVKFFYMVGMIHYWPSRIIIFYVTDIKRIPNKIIYFIFTMIFNTTATPPGKLLSTYPQTYRLLVPLCSSGRKRGFFHLRGRQRIFLRVGEHEGE